MIAKDYNMLVTRDQNFPQINRVITISFTKTNNLAIPRNNGQGLQDSKQGFNCNSQWYIGLKVGTINSENPSILLAVQPWPSLASHQCIPTSVFPAFPGPLWGPWVTACTTVLALWQLWGLGNLGLLIHGCFTAVIPWTLLSTKIFLLLQRLLCTDNDTFTV